MSKPGRHCRYRLKRNEARELHERGWWQDYYLALVAERDGRPVRPPCGLIGRVKVGHDDIGSY